MNNTLLVTTLNNRRHNIDIVLIGFKLKVKFLMLLIILIIKLIINSIKLTHPFITHLAILIDHMVNDPISVLKIR